LCMTYDIYIYIYIYREREREREYQYGIVLPSKHKITQFCCYMQHLHFSTGWSPGYGVGKRALADSRGFMNYITWLACLVQIKVRMNSLKFVVVVVVVVVVQFIR